MAQETRLHARAIREHGREITGSRDDYDPLVELGGNSRFALLGEASHGTHDFYHTRAEITKRLIEEKGFCAVAVEADWPDAYRVNRYVQGRGSDADAVEALGSFQRFPTWMWRNTEVVEFVGWLREYNEQLPQGRRKVGFYGLDLYSLHASARAVLDFLEKVDPEAARRARYRYSCFEHFGEDVQSYGYAASFGLSKTCEDEVIGQHRLGSVPIFEPPRHCQQLISTERPPIREQELERLYGRPSADVVSDHRGFVEDRVYLVQAKRFFSVGAGRVKLDRDLPLLFAASFCEFFLGFDDRQTGFLSENQSGVEVRFGDFVCRAFIHDDVAFVADVNQVEIALEHLGMGRVGEELAGDSAHTHGAQRTLPWYIAHHQCRAFKSRE